LLYEDEPIIIDFGLAKSESTGTISINAGTWCFAPPEQRIKAMGIHSGSYTDIFSCGATLYYLIRRNDKGINIKDLIESLEYIVHEKDNEKYIRKDLNGLVKKEVIDCIVKSMKYNYKERYK